MGNRASEDRKGAVSQALSPLAENRVLRADRSVAGDGNLDRAAGAALPRRPTALAGLDAVVGDREVRDGEHAGVVGVVGLDARHERADVGLGSRLVGAILEREVRRNRDREQDADDDDDNEKLDEGEAAFLTGQPLPDLAGHAEAPSIGANRGPHRDRCITEGSVRPSPWATLVRVIANYKPRREAGGKGTRAAC